MPTESTGVKPPWFADKTVPILMYRVNRRPRQQGNLFAEQPTDFLVHLTECLLFGSEVVTARRGHERRWRLGNSDINVDGQYLGGWVGFSAVEAEEQDDYDESTASYRPEVVETPRRSTAPFIILARSQSLFVAKHPRFAERSLPNIFEILLNKGEGQRKYPTTYWAVEPLLDSGQFQQWLDNTAVVESVTFTVKRPNPDGEESFMELDEHITKMRVGELLHRMHPVDKEQGLSKDFTQDRISVGTNRNGEAVLRQSCGKRKKCGRCDAFLRSKRTS